MLGGQWKSTIVASVLHMYLEENFTIICWGWHLHAELQNCDQRNNQQNQNHGFHPRNFTMIFLYRYHKDSLPKSQKIWQRMREEKKKKKQKKKHSQPSFGFCTGSSSSAPKSWTRPTRLDSGSSPPWPSSRWVKTVPPWTWATSIRPIFAPREPPWRLGTACCQWASSRSRTVDTEMVRTRESGRQRSASRQPSEQELESRVGFETVPDGGGRCVSCCTVNESSSISGSCCDKRIHDLRCTCSLSISWTIAKSWTTWYILELLVRASSAKCEHDSVQRLRNFMKSKTSHSVILPYHAREVIPKKTLDFEPQLLKNCQQWQPRNKIVTVCQILTDSKIVRWRTQILSARIGLTTENAYCHIYSLSCQSCQRFTSSGNFSICKCLIIIQSFSDVAVQNYYGCAGNQNQQPPLHPFVQWFYEVRRELDAV